MWEFFAILLVVSVIIGLATGLVAGFIKGRKMPVLAVRKTSEPETIEDIFCGPTR